MIRDLAAWLTPERRRELYRVVLVGIPLLVALNLLAAEQAAAWATLAQAVLGLTAGVVAAANAAARWRAWLYAIAAAVNALLLTLGVIPETTAPIVLALVAAVLSLGGGGLSLAFLSTSAPTDKEPTS